MKSLILKNNDLPDLGDMAKERIKAGFWSLVRTIEQDGIGKLYIKAEKKTFEITETGKIKKIIKNGDFEQPIIARLNFS